MSTKDRDADTQHLARKAQAGRGSISDMPTSQDNQNTRSKDALIEVEGGGSWYWIPDKDAGLVASSLVENYRDRKSDTETFLKSGVDAVTLPKKQYHGQRLTKFNLTPVQDLVGLQEIADGFILNNFNCRFNNNKFYTHCGPRNVFYVHPFKSHPVHQINQQATELYEKTPFNSAQFPAHIYSITHRVYERCIEKPRGDDGSDFAIVINGHRNSGIETNAMRSLQYLCQVGVMKGLNPEPAKNLLMANSLIQAFGYSATMQDQSPHFTRVTTVKLNKMGLVSGGTTDYFGLEQEVVTNCPKGARNFNAFYQLFKMPLPFRRTYGCLEPNRFSYLKNTDLNKAYDVDSDYKDTMQALAQLDFAEPNFPFIVLATILHIGNLNFTYADGKGAALIKSETIDIVADILMVDVDDLSKALCDGAKSAEQAALNRDSLARHMYALLFDFVINKVNSVLDTKAVYPSIKIVESRGVGTDGSLNKWGMVTSNYFAEKVYNYYTNTMFSAEEEVLRHYLYGSAYKLPVAYTTNQSVLDFMEVSPNGLLPASVSSKSAQALLAIMEKEGSEAFGKGKLTPQDPSWSPAEFVVKHFVPSKGPGFSSDACYDADDFVVASKMKLSPALEKIFNSSNVMKVLGTSQNKGSTADDIKKQGTELMEMLSPKTTIPFFVHCIRSNKDSAEGTFHGATVLQQIRTIQVVELAKSIKKGMPFKRSHKEFLCRYFSIAPRSVFAKCDFTELEEEDEATTAYCNRLQENLSQSPLMRNFHQSKPAPAAAAPEDGSDPAPITGTGSFVFFNKMSTNKTLERFRNKEVASSVKVLVRSLKTFLFREKVRGYISMSKKLKAAMASKNLVKLQMLVEQADGMATELEPVNWPLQAQFRHTVQEAQAAIAHLEEQDQVKHRLDILLEKDAYENFDEYKTVIEVCKKLKLEGLQTQEARGKFNTAMLRKKAERMMDEGLLEYDKGKINEALALSVTERLKNEYDFFFEKKMDLINKTQIKIEEEEAHFPVLEDIILTTAIKGSPGNLNYSAVDNDKLNYEVVQLKIQNIKSKDGAVLIRSAHFCLELRENVLKGNDKIVAQVLDRWNRFPTIHGINTEFELVKEDLENRRMLALLKGRIHIGKITGRFGHINIDDIQTEQLDDAITQAEKIPEVERLREFSETLYASKAIVRVRRELKAALTVSKRLELFRAQEDAEAKTLADVLRKMRRLEVTPSDLLSDDPLARSNQVQIARKRQAIAEQQRAEEEKAKNALLDKKRERTHEKGSLDLEVKHCWERLKFTLLEANAALLHEFTRAEVQLAQIVWDEHDISEMLIRSLKNGAAGNDKDDRVGRMNMAKIELYQLKSTLKRAAEATELSVETQNLRKNAEVILDLRAAVKQEDWDEVYRVISVYKFNAEDDHAKAMKLPQSVLEIGRSFQEWQFVRTIKNLHGACMEGAPRGVPGALDYSTVSVARLNEAIMKAEKAKVPAKECDDLLAKAHYIKRIRVEVAPGQHGDRDHVIELCTQAIENGFADVDDVDDEIRKILEDQNHHLIIDCLSNALSLPGISGLQSDDPEAWEHLTVPIKSVEALKEALAFVKKIDCKTLEIQETIKAAEYILDVRETVLLDDPDEPYTMAGKWSWLHRYVQDPKREFCGRTAEGETAEDCLSNDDLPLVANHCLNKVVQMGLAQALKEGKAAGDPGHINLESISTVKLDQKIEFAEKFITEEYRMKDTKELLVAANDIRTLRTMLKSQAYSSVERVLMKLDGEKVAPICLPEIHHAHNEVEYHIVADELKEALTTGLATGKVGQMNTGTIELGLLDRAITHAMDVEFTSANLQKLLVSAVLVRRLRAALQYNKWKAVTQLIKFTERKDIVLDDLVMSEVERSRQEVVARAVVAELEMAVEKGDAEAIRVYLAQAKQNPIASTEAAHETMERAAMYLEKVDECKEELPMAMQAAFNVPDLLTSVLTEADEVGYNSQEVQSALQIHDEIKKITLSARRALLSKDKAAMEDSIRQLETNGLLIPELQQLKEMVALPETQLLQQQLVAAVRQNNESRVAAVTCRMKELYFLQHGFVDFALKNFPRLKTEIQFASKEMFRDPKMDHYHKWESVQRAIDQKRKGMLLFTKDHLHTSLTHLPPSIPKATAVHSFAVFSEYISANPPPGIKKLVAHMLHMAVQKPPLRDEFYVQVIKQMTNNPSTKSIIRSWKLFELCLMTFPPSEDFENFLEAFIRNRHDSESRLRKLHLILYVGRKTGDMPSEENILRMVCQYKPDAP